MTMNKRIVLILAALCCVWAQAASMDVVIEDFDNCPVGTYSTYGGNDLNAVGHLSGWEVGGRYFNIIDRGGGDMDMTGNATYGSLSVGTAIVLSSNSGTPSYEASEALDMSGSTYLKFTFKNNTAYSGAFQGGGSANQDDIYMYYWDASAGATVSVRIYAETDAAFGYWTAGQEKVFTKLLSDITGFDKSADRVYGFRYVNSYGYIGNNHYGSLTWVSLAYDVPQPQPGTLIMMR